MKIFEAVLVILDLIGIIGEIILIYMYTSEKWEPSRSAAVLSSVALIMWMLNSLTRII